MKKIRAAVVGCGAISHNCHLPGYAADKNCEIVAVADPNDKNRKSATSKFDIGRAYASVEEMFEKEELDCVSVASPNAFHAEHALLALKHGCHVLCEKPLCATKKNAQAIIKAVEKTKTIFMTAFTHRYFRGNEKVKKAVEAGKIGKPYMIRVRFAHEGPIGGWAMSNSFYQRNQAVGGALFDMGIHAIDLAAWLMGPIVKVNAMTATLEKEIELDDNALLQFQFANGTLGYAEAGWTSRQGFAGYEIYGSEAAIIVDYGAGTVTQMKGRVKPNGERLIRKKVLDTKALEGGWPAELKHFIQCVRKNEQPAADVYAGVHSLQVALGAYESSLKGKTVTIR
ncbi:MAG: hypothetical protein GC154_03350 [bacterium]|nr:hypothetical protein [bacterium]